MTSMISAMFQVLMQGRELANPAAWKKGGAALGALTAILSVLLGLAIQFGWVQAGTISLEDVAVFASGVVAIVSTVLSYLSIATSKTVGVRPRGSIGSPGSGLPSDSETKRTDRVQADSFFDD